MIYKRINITIESKQYTGKNAEEIREWAGKAIQEKSFELHFDEEKNPQHLSLFSPKGLTVVFVNDYIVKEGDVFYTLNESIFNSLFEGFEMGGEFEDKVTSVKIDYKCPKCNIGYLRPTGMCYPTSPPIFPHKCNNQSCDHGQTIRGKQYPYIDYK